MMEPYLNILWTGIFIGVLISAPMGPIGMLVIQRTLVKGRWPAFCTGIGAAFSDLFYCLLCGLGISFITDFIEQHQFMLQLVGGVVLAAFGIYLFMKNPTRSLKTAQRQNSTNFFKEIGTGFLLTFSNPLILFFIIGLFARFNFIVPEFGLHHYILAYVSIFGGAMMWWYGVTFLVNLLRKRINVRSLWLVNRIIGSLLIIMAVVGLIYSLKDNI